MDVLPRIFRPLFELFRAMSLPQRATVAAVPLLMLSALVWMVVFNRPDDSQPVLFGKVFASDELATAEKALNQAGLMNYRREDRKLLVPAAELDRYNAALVEFDAVPPDLGSQILKQFESLGPFSTDRHRQEMKDALLLQELRRMIKAVPDIEDARVTVASSGRRVGFGQKPRVTANVTVKPRTGRELNSRLVASLRQAVASMVPDLLPVDVTVFDVARGQAYTGEQADDPLDGQLIQRVREFTRQYEQQIQKGLSFIPNATVAVHVDLDNLKSSVTRKERVRTIVPQESTIANRPGAVQQVSHEDADSVRHSSGFRGSDIPSDVTREVSERELLAAMPKAVQVSVSIPSDYYRDVAARRKAQGTGRSLDLETIEEEVLTKVERTVGRLIPAGSSPDAISVTTVDRMPTETTEPILSTTDQLGILAWRHGGSLALGLFVVWALWMLSRLSYQGAPLPAPVEPAISRAPETATPANPVTAVPEPSVNKVQEQEQETPPPGLKELLTPATITTPHIPIPAAPVPNVQQVSQEPTVRRSEAFVIEGPFAFLNHRHADDIRELLIDEQPQTIAVIAAQLPPAMSAAVLAGFTPDRQADVLQRVARLGPTDPEILNVIAVELKERLGRPRTRAGGVAHAAAVLRESSRANSRTMLAGMDDRDSDLADELRQTLFAFDDLLKLDDETIRVILQETDDRPWALALKASPEPVRQRVLGCLSPRVARAFKEEMESLGPIRLSEMTSVRQQIADSIRRLEDAGLIALPTT
ncbi:MAG: FliG C-terminal domain-containing protein [Planctomycetota bacterium]